MTDRKVHRPSIGVIGLGDYYTKLRAGLWKHFNPLVLLDADGSVLTRLPKEDAAIFRHIGSFEEARTLLDSVDLVVVLSPNDTHARYATLIAETGKPIVVEKPIATTKGDLEALRKLSAAGAPIYFSDFYVDVRAVPLMFALGFLGANDWRRGLVSGNTKVTNSMQDIGLIRRVHGRIAETYQFRANSWLGRAEAGGVIFDMMIHLFALLKRLFPYEDLEIKHCQRLYMESDGKPGRHVASRPSGQAAEAFAQIQGLLVPSEIPVLFEVEKGALTQDRHFTVQGTEGFFSQRFETDHPFQFVTRRNNAQLKLKGDRHDHYELTCCAIRKWCEHPVTYGWEWAAWAAEKAIAARDWRPPELVSKPVPPPTETRAVSSEHGIGRRLFMAHMGLTAALIFVESLKLVHEERRETRDRVAEDRRSVTTLELEQAAGESEPFLDAEQLDLVSDLLASKERIVLCPGTEHRYGKPTWELSLRGYPHDLRAVAPFRFLAKSPAEVLEVKGIPSFLQPGDVVVGTGSPSSSLMASLLMSSLASQVRNLPYRIEEIPGDPFVKVYSEMEKGEIRDKIGKQLVDGSSGEPLYSDHDNVDPSSGWLKSDVLLVSRLPGVGGNYDVLLFSGFHGAGTQAAELLFRKNVFATDDLRKLVRLLDGHEYWQFVLEVGDVENIGNVEKTKRKTVAHSIRLSQSCPPQAFRPDAGTKPRHVV